MYISKLLIISADVSLLLSSKRSMMTRRGNLFTTSWCKCWSRIIHEFTPIVRSMCVGCVSMCDSVFVIRITNHWNIYIFSIKVDEGDKDLESEEACILDLPEVVLSETGVSNIRCHLLSADEVGSLDLDANEERTSNMLAITIEASLIQQETVSRIVIKTMPRIPPEPRFIRREQAYKLTSKQSILGHFHCVG